MNWIKRAFRSISYHKKNTITDVLSFTFDFIPILYPRLVVMYPSRQVGNGYGRFGRASEEACLYRMSVRYTVKSRAV